MEPPGVHASGGSPITPKQTMALYLPEPRVHPTLLTPLLPKGFEKRTFLKAFVELQLKPARIDVVQKYKNTLTVATGKVVAGTTQK